jgi:hypothetical protein
MSITGRRVGHVGSGPHGVKGLTVVAHHEMSCWPPSMSYVAPVSAVLVMM